MWRSPEQNYNSQFYYPSYKKLVSTTSSAQKPNSPSPTSRQPDSVTPEEDTDRDQAKAWLDRGYEQWMAGRYEEAVASYDQALNIKLDLHEAWFYRGVALEKLGQLEEAVAS